MTDSAAELGELIQKLSQGVDALEKLVKLLEAKVDQLEEDTRVCARNILELQRRNAINPNQRNCPSCGRLVPQKGAKRCSWCQAEMPK